MKDSDVEYLLEHVETKEVLYTLSLGYLDDYVVEKCLEHIQGDFLTVDSLVKGFYDQNPTANPQPHEREITGKFNDSSKGNSIYTSTKTNKYTCSYYGDFATEKENGYRYNSGQLGWKNGKYIDIPPSWESYSNTEIYYKGRRISDLPAGGFEKLSKSTLITLSEKGAGSEEFFGLLGFYAYDADEYLYIITKNTVERKKMK